MRRMLLALMTVVAALPAAAQFKTVPAEFHGKWVPVKATCESTTGMTVFADRLTLFNGKDTESIGGIEMAGPGFFPPGYRGIQAVAITEFNGQQPATATFDAGEKKGVATVEFAPIQPSSKPTPQLTAYNARISKLSLGRRFPLHNVPLKRCPK